jgi:pre-rRNA-processing protein TSR1
MPPTEKDLCGSIYLTSDRQKQTLQLLLPSRNFIDILDTVKVTDFCVFLLSAEEEVDQFGELCLRAIQSQGVPSVVNVVQVINAYSIHDNL